MLCYLIPSTVYYIKSHYYIIFILEKSHYRAFLTRCSVYQRSSETASPLDTNSCKYSQGTQNRRSINRQLYKAVAPYVVAMGSVSPPSTLHRLKSDWFWNSHMGTCAVHWRAVCCGLSNESDNEMQWGLVLLCNLCHSLRRKEFTELEQSLCTTELEGCQVYINT